MIQKISSPYKPTIAVNSKFLTKEFFKKILSEQKFTIKHISGEFWMIQRGKEKQPMQILEGDDLETFYDFVTIIMTIYLNTKVANGQTKPKSKKEDYFLITGSQKFIKDLLYVIGMFILIQHSYVLKNRALKRSIYHH